MSAVSLIITSCFFVFALVPNDAARILAYFPVPSISHQVVFRPLTQELARRGHEVIVITADPAFKKGEVPKNLTEIDVHDISYKIWSDTIMTQAKGSKNDHLVQIRLLLSCMINVVDAQLKEKEVKNILQNKNQKFDLIFTEAVVGSALVVSHIFKAPVIQVSSFGAVNNFQTSGVPMHPFLYPPLTRHRLNNLTYWEKLTELYNDYVVQQIYKDVMESENKMLKKHIGDDTPSTSELKNNVHMQFFNIHPIFEGIRPVPPNVIFMGGLHQKPDKELPADLKLYLDSSKHGVIYVSFGTNVDPSLLPPQKIQTMIQTFSKLPYDVLWKWNKDEMPGRSANIKLSKWLPQSDLLKHPKIKLFITQVGLQSTDEAITAGVPMIGLPMLGDQWFNAERQEYHKIGVKLDMETLTEERFTQTIKTVIGDESYRQNIIRLRELIHDQPMQPLERAIWWTEYILRHGGAEYLKSPGANITWSQYLELELLCFVLTIILAVVILLFVAIRSVYNLILKNYIFDKIKRN